MKKLNKKTIASSVVTGIMIGFAVYFADCIINPGNKYQSISAGILLASVSTISILSIIYVRSVQKANKEDETNFRKILERRWRFIYVFVNKANQR